MKQERIELRTSHDERLLLSEAATYVGLTLSSFLRNVALEKSEEILKERDLLTLSDKDRDLFLAACENPPAPNKRLQQAFKTYEKKKLSGQPKLVVKKRRSKPSTAKTR